MDHADIVYSGGEPCETAIELPIDSLTTGNACVPENSPLIGQDTLTNPCSSKTSTDDELNGDACIPLIESESVVDDCITNMEFSMHTLNPLTVGPCYEYDGTGGTLDPPKKFSKNANYHGTGRLPCPSLGENWMIEQIVRQQGKSAGRYDTYYYSPSGAKIRSKLKLREYVDIDLTNFDYNSGKFTEKGQGTSPTPIKPKMSHLKTEELKTIERSNEGNLIRSPPIKRKLTVKLPKKSKRQRTKAGMSVMAITDEIDDDCIQNSPFEAFKNEAITLSNHFADMKDYEDLIQFAWNFLSIESKTYFNDLACSIDKGVLSNDSDSFVVNPPKHQEGCEDQSCSQPLEGLRNHNGHSSFASVSNVSTNNLSTISGVLANNLTEGRISMVSQKSSAKIANITFNTAKGSTIVAEDRLSFGDIDDSKSVGNRISTGSNSLEFPETNSVDLDTTGFASRRCNANNNSCNVQTTVSVSLINSASLPCLESVDASRQYCEDDSDNLSVRSNHLHIKQKPHKRKSRVPVCIKQDTQ